MRIALASTLLVAACNTSDPNQVPSHCEQLPDNPDGLYTLYVGGDPTKPWLAYCADGMTSEYLPLAPVEGRNFSELRKGDAVVRTTFSMLRIDADALAIDIGDHRFATSEGSATFGDVDVTAAPYGVAIEGRANIDLRGTAFQVASAFTTAGEAKAVAVSQIVDLDAPAGIAAPAAVDMDAAFLATGLVLPLRHVQCDAEGVCVEAAAAAAGVELVQH